MFITYPHFLSVTDLGNSKLSYNKLITFFSVISNWQQTDRHTQSPAKVSLSHQSYYINQFCNTKYLAFRISHQRTNLLFRITAFYRQFLSSQTLLRFLFSTKINNNTILSIICFQSTILSTL